MRLRMVYTMSLSQILMAVLKMGMYMSMMSMA